MDALRSTARMQPSRVAGIFVGGGSTRMGGVPKGLLRVASGETIVERWRRIFEELTIPCVLVGERAKEAYEGVGLDVLADDPAARDLGPLGGVLSLLAHAGDRKVIAVACDMPFVSRDLVQRLCSAAPGAAAVAARREGRWEPFFARYDARTVLPIAIAHARERRSSLQALLDAARAEELLLTGSEHAELRDWDTPADTGPST